MREAGRGRNRRRICGVAPLYVLSKIFEGAAAGELLDHSYAVVDNQNSFVTFASMAFYEEERGVWSRQSEQMVRPDPVRSVGGILPKSMA